jgi:hypothetical protein
MQLMLSQLTTNDENQATLALGNLSQSYKDALQDSPSNCSFRTLDQQYQLIIDVIGSGESLNMIDHYMK